MAGQKEAKTAFVAHELLRIDLQKRFRYLDFRNYQRDGGPSGASIATLIVELRFSCALVTNPESLPYERRYF